MLVASCIEHHLVNVVVAPPRVVHFTHFGNKTNYSDKCVYSLYRMLSSKGNVLMYDYPFEM